MVRTSRRRALGVIAVLAAGGALPAAAQTAAFPSRPIRLIVPHAPGGNSDTFGRILAQKLSERIGQQVVVENRPGAGGTIGIAALARSPADGYTLAVVSTGHVVNPVLYANLPYATLKDFAGVTPLAGQPSVLVVSPSLGVRTAKELVDMAKAKPGQLNYATAGTGSAAHIRLPIKMTIAVTRRTTTKPHVALNRSFRTDLPELTRKRGNLTRHARMLPVMHCHGAQKYDRYHKRRPDRYNRKSPYQPGFAGFASVAIGG